MNLQRAQKRRWIIITAIWTRNEMLAIIGKQDSIDLFDEGKSNTSQYHTPGYDGGMWKYSKCIRGR